MVLLAKYLQWNSSVIQIILSIETQVVYVGLLMEVDIKGGFTSNLQGVPVSQWTYKSLNYKSWAHKKAEGEKSMCCLTHGL